MPNLPKLTPTLSWRIGEARAELEQDPLSINYGDLVDMFDAIRELLDDCKAELEAYPPEECERRW